MKSRRRRRHRHRAQMLNRPRKPRLRSSLGMMVSWKAKAPGRWFDRASPGLFEWEHKGSNLGPLPCEGSALPLSYAPEFSE